MKETALEWLANLLPKIDFEDDPYYRDLFEQAKEIEKQQIIDAIAESNKSNNRNVSLNPEQYYNETFKS
jgi:hypothetical protein